MLHALFGQYFYIPFFTENVELHIGDRNKLDKYSGGCTAWQDERQGSSGSSSPFRAKLWYGWFGRGTENEGDIIPIVLHSIQKLFVFVFQLIFF